MTPAGSGSATILDVREVATVLRDEVEAALQHRGHWECARSKSRARGREPEPYAAVGRPPAISRVRATLWPDVGAAVSSLRLSNLESFHSPCLERELIAVFDALRSVHLAAAQRYHAGAMRRVRCSFCGRVIGRSWPPRAARTRYFSPSIGGSFGPLPRARQIRHVD